MDKIEDVLLLGVAAVFLCLSAILMAQVLWGRTPGTLLPWLPLAIICFLLALAAKELSPRNRARVLRKVIDQNRGPISAEQLSQMQNSVGSAGFFNRIGLTGIPLAVALLAMVLSGLVFAAQKLGYQPAADAFLHMTTVAVGAFVGALTGSKGPGSAKAE